MHIVNWGEINQFLSVLLNIFKKVLCTSINDFEILHIQAQDWLGDKISQDKISQTKYHKINITRQKSLDKISHFFYFTISVKLKLFEFIKFAYFKFILIPYC